MTAKEAIDCFKHPTQHWSGERDEADRMAIEALEKAEIYRWHDLRKNPDDLPREDLRVEIILYTHREFRNVFGILYKGEYIVNGFVTYMDVVAWRYIEPFEEVSE